MKYKFLTILLLTLTTCVFAQVENNYFELDRRMIIEQYDQDSLSEGALMFEDTAFFLIVEMKNFNARKNKAKIEFSIARILDSTVVYTIKDKIELSSSGRKTGVVLNDSLYQNYRDSLRQINRVIKDTYSQLDSLDANEQVLRDQLTKIIEDKQLEKALLKEVKPEFEYTDYFKDIVGSVMKDGILTEDGRRWARRLPLLGREVRNFTKK